MSIIMMLIAMIVGIIMCMFFGVMNVRYYKRNKRKGNLYTAILDFAVAIFMIIVLITQY